MRGRKGSALKLRNQMPTRRTTGSSQDKLPAFFYRLPPHAQRCYLESDSITRYEFVPDAASSRSVAALTRVLAKGNAVDTENAARKTAAEMCRMAGVAPVAVDVREVRPKNARGELHGLFYPADPRRRMPPNIVLWMRTAERREVVKPRTFVRTLMHELVHYFDYSVLKLEDSFHTRGFFARESYLVRTTVALKEAAPKPEEGPALLRAWLDRHTRDPDR
ncbi:MAG TPA: hypothetical protein VMH37_09355 [Candidatus Binataceae bacterium]|nr:hypothetical protein [Candidatus Binataceae bacterium]